MDLRDMYISSLFNLISMQAIKSMGIHVYFTTSISIPVLHGLTFFPQKKGKLLCANQKYSEIIFLKLCLSEITGFLMAKWWYVNTNQYELLNINMNQYELANSCWEKPKHLETTTIHWAPVYLLAVSYYFFVRQHSANEKAMQFLCCVQ